MSILVDIFVIIIILFSVIFNLKRGFVKSIVGLLSLILTVLLISYVSQPISEFVYDNFIHKSVCESIEENEKNQIDKETKNYFDILPDFAKEAAQSAGIDANDVSEIIKNNVASGNKTEVISRTIVRPAAIKLISIFVDVILFAILMFLFSFISKFICSFFKIPLLNEANKFLGAVLGLLKGIIIAAFVCSLVSYISETSEGGFLIFNKETISNSVLFNFFSNVL